MKKIAIAICMSLLGLSTLLGQGNQRGDFNINIGAGFFPSNLEEGESVDVTPLHIIGDYSIIDYVSVGLHFGYGTTKQELQFKPENQDTVLDLRRTSGTSLLMLRSDFHFPIKSPYLDVYAGGSIGIAWNAFAFRNASDNTVIETPELDTQSKEFAWEARLGARYRLGEHIGFYLEGGYGLVYLKAGINLKL